MTVGAGSDGSARVVAPEWRRYARDRLDVWRADGVRPGSPAGPLLAGAQAASARQEATGDEDRASSPGTRTCSTAEPPPSDVTMRTHFVNGIQVSESVTYTRGPRQRVEFPGLVSITQCDLARTVFLNDKTKSYAVQAHVSTPATAAEPPAPAASQAVSPGPPARTGKVVYTTTITDTGDRKQVFGREARHFVPSRSKTRPPRPVSRAPRQWN